MNADYEIVGRSRGTRPRTDRTTKLEQENKRLRMELEHTQARLVDMTKARDALQEAMDKYMYEYSERYEALAEARIQYEDMVKQIRDLKKKYDREAAQWIAAILKTGKAV